MLYLDLYESLFKEEELPEYIDDTGVMLDDVNQIKISDLMHFYDMQDKLDGYAYAAGAECSQNGIDRALSIVSMPHPFPWPAGCTVAVKYNSEPDQCVGWKS